jgi:hypothetical protein
MYFPTPTAAAAVTAVVAESAPPDRQRRRRDGIVVFRALDDDGERVGARQHEVQTRRKVILVAENDPPRH